MSAISFDPNEDQHSQHVCNKRNKEWNENKIYHGDHHNSAGIHWELSRAEEDRKHVLNKTNSPMYACQLRIDLLYKNLKNWPRIALLY